MSEDQRTLDGLALSRDALKTLVREVLREEGILGQTHPAPCGATTSPRPANFSSTTAT